VHLNGVERWLWAAGLIGHILLLAVLIVRKRVQRFPLFTAFVLWNLVRTVILFFVFRLGTTHAYYYTFWSCAVVGTLLQFGIIYELYAQTFRPLGIWAPDIRKAFLGLISGSLLVALGLTMAATPHTRLGIQAITMKGDFFSSIWVGELFVGMIALSVKSGLPWDAHVGRISQAFGLYSLLNAFLASMETYFGLGSDINPYETLQQVRQVIYLGCIAYWIIMLWKNAPDARMMSEYLRLQLIRLQARVEAELLSIRKRNHV